MSRYLPASACDTNALAGKRGCGKRSGGGVPSHEVTKSKMNHSQKRRTPEQIRAGNLRLGLILLAIAAVFFVSIVLKFWLSL